MTNYDQDIPYNNENFYPLNDDQQMPFNFMQTHPNESNGRRPQSANIRITKDRAARNKKNNLIKGNIDVRKSNEDVINYDSAQEIRENLRGAGQYREIALTNQSHFTKSPSKIQQRVFQIEKKKEKWNLALKHEKEYLYDEALKFKKEKNSKVSENKMLSARCRYLEKELKKREITIKDLMHRPLQYPAYSSPAIQSKQALEALQKSYESNLVINLKKLIEDQKSQLVTKENLINTLKHDMKGTY